MYCTHSENLDQAVRIAVFADIENVAGNLDELGLTVDVQGWLVQLSKIGRITHKRSFGDISSMPPRLGKSEIRKMLQRNNFQHEDVPHLGRAKNSADVRLVVAVMALAHQRPDISHFAILSADRDFVPLVNYLHELGRTVIGCAGAPHQVNELYFDACDLFLFQHHGAMTISDPAGVAAQVRAGVPANVAMPASNTHRTATEDQESQSCDADMLVAAIRSVQLEGREAVASVVAARLREMYPASDYRLKHGTFKAFCQVVAAESGRIALTEMAPPHFLLRLVGDSTPQPRPTSLQTTSSLAEHYRIWAEQRLKMPIPTPVIRRLVYAAMQRVMQLYPAGLALQTLGTEVEAILPGLGKTAYRLGYGLYRAGALRGTVSDEYFNPTLMSFGVGMDQLDHYFMRNIVVSHRRVHPEAQFDAAAWSEVLMGDGSATDEIERASTGQLVTP